MLVSAIIASARLKADVPNTSFYTDAEALADAQASWCDLYAILAQNDDDYFITKTYLSSPLSVSAGSFAVGTDYVIGSVGTTDFMLVGASSNTVGVQFTATGAGSGTGTAYQVTSAFHPDTNRQSTYLWPMPATFYRLRLLQYQDASGAGFYPVQKMTIENFGNAQGTPAYRLVGTNVELYDPNGYSTYCLWFYPAPATLALATNLTYPTSVVQEVMVYQVAAEIRRKQRLPTDAYEARRNELVQTMLKQTNRDDFKAVTPKNNFSTGFAPYI
jgi:hypothetical protein